MTAPEILRDMVAKGIRLDVDGDHLRVRAPKGVLTESVVSQLREVKPHLLELLGVPRSHRKAKSLERCARCRTLEADGITVLLCSECDKRIRH